MARRNKSSDRSFVLFLFGIVLVLGLPAVAALPMLWPEKSTALFEDAPTTLEEVLAVFEGPDSRSRREQSKTEADRYMQQLQHRVKKYWRPSRVKENQSVTVLFRIASDGSLAELGIRKSSGNPDMDQAALKAVRNSAPFAPVPATLLDDGKAPSLAVQFTFDHNEYQSHKNDEPYSRRE